MSIICIAGEWHQASVLGACFASLGHEVRGAVSTPDVAARLNAGVPPVHEPELPELMRTALQAGTLRYTEDAADALRGAEYVFLALDTPVADDDSPVLDEVVATARRVASGLSGPITLVVTAQVPVGTTERLGAILAATGHAVVVAYVPEFLRLGTAVRTFMEADRFLIGCDDAAAAARLDALYAPLGRPVLRMDVRSAEMAKHASNAFLALSISFANEIADLCDHVGADIELVTRGMKLDARIGPRAFLSAGLGFAGGTLGRDLRALQQLGSTHGCSTLVADAAVGVNAARAALVLRHVEQLNGAAAGQHVAVLGLTYKPGTSTMRRSIALDIIRQLVARGATVSAYDPLATMDGVTDAPRFERAADPYAAAEGADAVVLVTEWDGFEDVDFGELRRRMRRPLFVDTRNRLDPDTMRRHGFTYVGVGRRGSGSAAPVELMV